MFNVFKEETRPRRKKASRKAHYRGESTHHLHQQGSKGFHLPHDDALVVSSTITNFNAQRILIDNGSSVDILFFSTFDKIKIGQDKLHLFYTPLIGFGGGSVHPIGWIKLPFIMGTKSHQTIVCKIS